MSVGVVEAKGENVSGIVERRRHLDTLVRSVLGPAPERGGCGALLASLLFWWKLTDYRVTAWAVRCCAGGSPRFVLFRCTGCNRLWTARRLSKETCPCGTRKLVPSGGVRTARLFVLMLLGR